MRDSRQKHKERIMHQEKRVEGVSEMTTPLQQLCATEEMSQIDCRSINLLTMLSKLVVALVLGIVVMIISLMS